MIVRANSTRLPRFAGILHAPPGTATDFSAWRTCFAGASL